ncbi:MAG: alkaline phosphatase D family protein [Verrucomicrobiota bacterium]
MFALCRLFTLLALPATFLMTAALLPAEEVSPQVLERIAFGSCDSQEKPQPIWDVIVKANPQLFLALGDNIYGDTTDMEVLKAKYAKLGSVPGYQKLGRTCPILATWDDHDFGVNDGGAGYSRKVESQQVMLDFYKVPENSPRRKRQGVYESWRFGPEGQRVQIILLDQRYFRSRPIRDTRPAEEKKKLNLVGWYVPNTDPKATILGDGQWAWLEEQLKLPADLRLIGASYQVIASEKGMESWGYFPLERQRLYDLIGKTGANGVVFLSGDVHFSEISETKDGPYPLLDFTSSGLTNSSPVWAAAVNSFRVSPIAYVEPTFGQLLIDWKASPATLTMEARGLKGNVAFSKTVALTDLRKK